MSARYFKQAMLISECNGRISELRAKGYVIETSQAKAEFGFVYHRLVDAPTQAEKPKDVVAKPKFRIEYDPKAGIARQVRVAV